MNNSDKVNDLRTMQWNQLNKFEANPVTNNNSNTTDVATNKNPSTTYLADSNSPTTNFHHDARSLDSRIAIQHNQQVYLSQGSCIQADRKDNTSKDIAKNSERMSSSQTSGRPTNRLYPSLTSTANRNFQDNETTTERSQEAECPINNINLASEYESRVASGNSPSQSSSFTIINSESSYEQLDSKGDLTSSFIEFEDNTSDDTANNSELASSSQRSGINNILLVSEYESRVASGHFHADATTTERPQEAEYPIKNRRLVRDFNDMAIMGDEQIIFSSNYSSQNNASLQSILVSTGYSLQEENTTIEDIITPTLQIYCAESRNNMQQRIKYLEENCTSFGTIEDVLELDTRTQKKYTAQRNNNIKHVSNILNPAVSDFLLKPSVTGKQIISADQLQKEFKYYIVNPKNGEEFLSHCCASSNFPALSHKLEEYGAFKEFPADGVINAQARKSINSEQYKLHTFNNLIDPLDNELLMVATSDQKDSSLVISNFFGMIEINNEHLKDLLGVIFCILG